MINNEKITNLIVYLSSKIEDLYITKLLKLIYLIDETSIKEAGFSITNLDYNVWQHGPVNIELYNSLTFGTEGIDFNNKISIIDKGRGRVVKYISNFNDDEFSDYEIELINKVIEEYGYLTSSKLVEILHKEDSLWNKIVKDKNLDKIFKSDEFNTSPYKINFEELLKDLPLKKAVYQSAKESLKFRNSLV